MSFAALGLSPALLATLQARGYHTPTTIQARVIKPILAGRDLIASAQTGTGKTAGFALPILQKLAAGAKVTANQARALVLVPTRELAVQVGDNITAYTDGLSLRVAVAYGGVKINPQLMMMRRGADVLVATPGRLLDLYRSNAVRFQQLEVLVLDEADRLLALGFADELNDILALLPRRRQSLLFSATFSPAVRTLARRLLRDPVEINEGARNTTAQGVKHWICPVDKKRKPALLKELLRDRSGQQVLVFVKTRESADRLARELTADGLSSVAIHGDRSQGARQNALAAFRDGKAQILVATDVAARGIDIDQLPLVVNFDLPKAAEDYIHRVGRTGRAGSRGEALSLVSADEFPQLSAIEQLLGKALPRRLIDGFEPDHDVPASRPLHKPLKLPAKKAHKPGKGRKMNKIAAGHGGGTQRYDTKTAGAAKPKGKPPRSKAAPQRGKPGR